MTYRSILSAGLLGAFVFAGNAVAQQNNTPDSAPPTLEGLQRAVATLPKGRVERPRSYEAMTPDQKQYLESILSGPRSAVSGPLAVMVAAPTLGDLAQRAMAYARFAGNEGFSSVPPKYNEIAVIMAAKLWSSPYVWEAHDRYAVRVGVPRELVDAIRLGTAPPANLPSDVKTVYEFLNELIVNKQVSDATFAAARTVLGGDRQVVDLVGTLAIYQMSAMLTAMDRTGLEPGEAPTLRPLE